MNIKMVLTFTLLILSMPTWSGVGTGKIVGYIPYSAGAEEILFIKFEQSIDTPACNDTKRLVMKSSNPRFKATQAVALAAMMSGTHAFARGANTCTNWANSEDLEYLCLGDIPC